MTNGSAPIVLPTCVIDASVTVKLFLEEEDADLASALMRPPRGLRGLVRAAPEFLELECGNVFWKRVRRGLLRETEARAALTDLKALGIEFWPDTVLSSLALDRALVHKLSVYDSSYLALSDLLGVPLVTADARLVTRAGGPSDRLILLSSLR
ncbi:MAG: type II toxin-antitoxin system VapC family toxin [Dehalococcoidia bacterium]